MKFDKEKDVAKRLMACGNKFAHQLDVPIVNQFDFACQFAQDMCKELCRVYADSCKEMSEQENEYASNVYVFYKRVEKEIKKINQ